MLKFNLDEIDVENGAIELSLNEIGYDDINVPADTYANKIAGDWNFSIPFTTDTKSVKEIQINQTVKGFTLESVTVSPYQVVTTHRVPSVNVELSNEDYEAYKNKVGDITYDEFVEREGTVPTPLYTMIFNQDGERLFTQEETYEGTISAVQGMDISKLKICLFDDQTVFEALDVLENNGKSLLTEAESKALLSVDVDVK
jgi:hypothetical protein